MLRTCDRVGSWGGHGCGRNWGIGVGSPIIGPEDPMNDSQLLSAFQELNRTPAKQRVPRRVLVFDACQLGVVLRALLFVEAVMAVGAMFGVAGVVNWVERMAFL